jgi:integral membrane sensor domain MASE1
MLRFIPLAVIVSALLCLVVIAPVDKATLWWGVPPLVLCSIIGVALLTPALALVEFTGRRRSADDEEASR